MSGEQKISYCKLNQKDWEEYKRHQGYAFLPDEGPEFPDKWRGPSIGEKRGLCRDDGIVSVARLLPVELNLRGVYHSGGGIADVATMPENRGQGHFKILMHSIIDEMASRGLYIAILWPSSYILYKKLGFRIAGTKKVYSVPFNKFNLTTNADDKGSLDFRFADINNCTDTNTGGFYPVDRGDEVQLLNSVYEQVASQYNLAIKRDSNWWNAFVTEQSMLSSGNPAYVYAYWRDSECEGYLVYDFKPTLQAGTTDKALTMNVRELIYTTSTAYYEMLKFISGHSLQANELLIDGAIDDFFPDKFQEPDEIDSQIELGPMLRITDVYQALSNLKIPDSFDEHITNDKVTLKITDELRKQNEGCYVIEINNGVLDVSGPLADDSNLSPDFVVDIGCLSQLYAGYMDIQTLVSKHNLESLCDREHEKQDKLKLLNQLFVKGSSFPIEYF